LAAVLLKVCSLIRTIGEANKQVLVASILTVIDNLLNHLNDQVVSSAFGSPKASTNLGTSSLFRNLELLDVKSEEALGLKVLANSLTTEFGFWSSAGADMDDCGSNERANFLEGALESLLSVNDVHFADFSKEGQ
jgi:hypothetical protein